MRRFLVPCSIMTYRDITRSGKIEPRRNPLAFYYFGKDKRAGVPAEPCAKWGCLRQRHHTPLRAEICLSGIGASGMGAYHGPEGLNMSHERAIQSNHDRCFTNHWCTTAFW